MDKSLVSKATAPDQNPTPGYILHQVAKISHHSNDASNQLVAFLVKRLAHNNTHAKLKTLRLLKHLCQHGHPTFKKQMQKSTQPVKDCIGEFKVTKPTKPSIPILED